MEFLSLGGNLRMEFKITISRIHHVAIICSDYAKSKRFYTEILCLPILSEIYREDRGSYKLDLALPDGVQIELFSFPNAAKRPSYPEACGLRHLAFELGDLDHAVASCRRRTRMFGEGLLRARCTPGLSRP